MVDTASTPDAAPSPATPARLTDHRRTPLGVMPPNLQQWLIAGIAVVMVAILALAGPPKPAPSTAPASSAPLAIDPNTQRIADYQRHVQEQAQRLASEQAALQLTKDAMAAPTTSLGITPGVARPPADGDLAGATRGYNGQPSQPTNDTPPARVADNVSYSRPVTTAKPDQLPGAADPTVPSVALALPPGFFNPVTTPIAPGARDVRGVGSSDPNERDVRGVGSSDPTATNPAHPPRSAAVPSQPSTPRYRLAEGTVIDAVLTNRLDGSFQGPVNALVSVPVYAAEHVVIPAGARVLGTSKPVTAFGETRLAVTFHRVLLPGGDRIDLDAVPALNPAGDLGLHDQVNRHYGEMFGASIALGLLAGFTQGHTPTGFEATADDRYRQGVASSFGQSGTRVLDRFLNLLPSVTIREGHRIKVYMSRELDLPAYRGGPTISGGDR